MKWFKHYTNAHKGEAIQSVAIEFGKTKAYGWYFLLVEYLTDMWDGHSEPTFKISVRVMSEFLEVKPKVLLRFLEHLKNAGKINFEQNQNILTINFPKLSEILHRDALRAGHRRAAGGKKPRLEYSNSNNNSSSSDNNRQDHSRNLSSGDIQDASYRTEELTVVTEILKQVFSGALPFELGRSTAKILATFKTPDTFREWAENVINAKNCPNPDHDRAGFSRYFSAALSSALRGAS